MKTSDFLLTYCFALYSIIRLYDDIDIDGVANTPTIFTDYGERITFAINQNINPNIGKIGHVCFNKNESLFDIAKDWVDENTWSYLSTRYNVDNNNKIRISYEQFCDTLDYFGGIDINKTIKYLNGK